MSYNARSEIEKDILEKFDKKIEDSGEVSEEVQKLISESLKCTTISQKSAAEEIAEELMEVHDYESD